MNKVIKTFVLTLAVAATTLSATASVVEARDRQRGEYWREGGGYTQQRHDRRHRNHNGRDAVIGGTLGLATGLIIGGAIANSGPRYYDERDEIYLEPDYTPEYRERRVYRRPVVIESYEPWTRSWYEYCSDRYRSFNPNTGTYRGYDGLDHFCVAGG